MIESGEYKKDMPGFAMMLISEAGLALDKEDLFDFVVALYISLKSSASEAGMNFEVLDELIGEFDALTKNGSKEDSLN